MAVKIDFVRQEANGKFAIAVTKDGVLAGTLGPFDSEDEREAAMRDAVDRGEKFGLTKSKVH